jgi:hypothetical protein
MSDDFSVGGPFDLTRRHFVNEQSAGACLRIFYLLEFRP